MDFRTPVEMDGRYIRLIPLSRDQLPALVRAGQDPEIWQWMPYGYCGQEEAMSRFFDFLESRQAAGTDLAFTTVLRPDDRPIGMTRYLNIDRPNSNVEVGGTWIESTLWRTPVNTESKLLMLGHAFDSEGCQRVQIKTDNRNVRSQRAIERLGAQREGILRQHMIRSDGTFRDSVVYSVVRSEWPEVRQRLEVALKRPWARPGRDVIGAARI